MDSFKLCRCGNRIPDDWPRCARCQEWQAHDFLARGIEDRMERAQMVRVAAPMNRLVGPSVDPEIQDAILEGLNKRSSERLLHAFLRKRRALQHIQVLQRNIQAYNLTLLEAEEGTQ